MPHQFKISFFPSLSLLLYSSLSPLLSLFPFRSSAFRSSSTTAVRQIQRPSSSPFQSVVHLLPSSRRPFVPREVVRSQPREVVISQPREVVKSVAFSSLRRAFLRRNPVLISLPQISLRRISNLWPFVRRPFIHWNSSHRSFIEIRFFLRDTRGSGPIRQHSNCS